MSNSSHVFLDNWSQNNWCVFDMTGSFLVDMSLSFTEGILNLVLSGFLELGDLVMMKDGLVDKFLVQMMLMNMLFL